MRVVVFILCPMKIGHNSIHHLPPGWEVQVDEEVVAIMEAVFQEQGIQYLKVKTWITDAPYRETPEKVKLRKAEGCLTLRWRQRPSVYRSVPGCAIRSASLWWG